MTFQNIKGHEATLTLLSGYLRQGRMHSSFLFIGPEGIGKFMVARELSKIVNCEAQSASACGQCPSCLKIEKGQHPDVHIIDAAGAGPAADEAEGPDDTPERSSQIIKIDQIRQLKRQAGLKAYEARKKVFIINDAHLMNPEAANCLLKTLEEPANDCLIILVTAKPSLLFKTVISRCQAVKFYPLKTGLLRDMLVSDYGLTQAQAGFLSVFSEGSLGRALMLRDSSLLQDKNRVIDEMALHKGARASSGHTADRAALRQYLNILATWFRDVYICKAGVEAAVFMHSDRASEIAACAKGYSWAALDDIMKFISDACLYTEQNINPKLLASNIRAML